MLRSLPWSTGSRKSPSHPLCLWTERELCLGRVFCSWFPHKSPGARSGTGSGCLELQTPAAQAAESVLDQPLAGGKNNPRGVERWNERRASIPAAEGSSTGTKPTEFVHLHRSDQAPVMCLSTK